MINPIFESDYDEVWLITGGAGFIGAHFTLQAIAQTNALVVVVDALTYAGDLSRLNPIRHHPRFKFIHGNINNMQLLKTIFEEYPVNKIIHFAAESHVDRSINDADIFLESNIHGTYHLLQVAREYWKDSERKHLFLHVSTDEVFGPVADVTLPADENSSYRPSSPYAASKAAADNLVRAWYTTYGIPMIITHCTNNYGPWQYPEKLIPRMILNALHERTLPIYGDGLHMRDWLHVDDHCQALLTLLKYGTIGETYCISAQDHHTNIHIVQQICSAIDNILQRATSSHDLILHINDRVGHDRLYALNSQKLRDQMHWQPQHKVLTEIPKLVAWYVDQTDWLQRFEALAFVVPANINASKIC